MLGRRRNFRHGVMNAEGVLRVLRDVTVSRAAADEFVAISTEPAVRGERLTLERTVDGRTVVEAVLVVEAKPALVRGSLRHRLRLRGLDRSAAGIAAGSGKATSRRKR
jgi:hypothetical protein